MQAIVALKPRHQGHTRDTRSKEPATNPLENRYLSQVNVHKYFFGGDTSAQAFQS